MWQSVQRPGSFPWQLRFIFQLFMTEASKLWLKHTISNNLWIWKDLITTYSYHIQSFHTLVQTNVITHWLYLLSIAGASKWYVSVQILPLREEGLNIGVLWGSLWVLLPLWPGQISFLYPSDDICKNQLSRPCSFRGDRCLSFPVFFCLVFY